MASLINHNIRKISSCLSILIVLTVCSVLIYVENQTSLTYSCIFIFLYFYILLIFYSFNSSFTSLISIFWLTLGVFIGGRFFCIFIDDIFLDKKHLIGDIFNLDFMAYTSLGLKQINKTMMIIMSWMSGFVIGYLLMYSESNEIHFNQMPSNAQVNISFKVACLLFVFIVMDELRMISFVNKFDYYSVYSDFARSKFIQYITYPFLITASVSLLTESYRKYSIVMLLITALLSSIAGARGELITMLLSILFVYGIFYQIKFRYIVLMLMASYLLLYLLTFISFRYDSSADFGDFLGGFTNFLFARGGVVGVIGYSVNVIPDLDVSLKFGWILPGFKKILLALAGKDFSNEYTSIAHYISFLADSSLYYDGRGMGSSIISESYMVTGSIFLSSLLAAIFGVFLAFLDRYHRTSVFVFIVSVSLSSSLFFCIRDSLESITYFMFNILLFYLVYCLFIRAILIKSSVKI